MVPPGDDGGRSGAPGPLLAWAALAASFVIGLAALVRLAGPGAAPDGPIGVIRVPGPVTAVVAGLFTLAAVVFLVHILRRRDRRPPPGEDGEMPAGRPGTPWWVRTLARALSLVYFVVLAYLVWRGAIPLADLMALASGAAAGGGGGPGGLPSPSAPAVVTWAYAILALGAGAGALGLALWVALGDRLGRWWKGPDGDPSPAPMVDAVAESLEDLAVEPDARRAIIRCYARFESVARAFRIERRPWWTPAEFMREALGRRRLPPAALATLTGLFELARFSDRALGPVERARALRALDEIRTAIHTGRADVIAR